MSGVRDEELKRLLKYAQGLGLKVTFTPYVPYSRDAGYWSHDGTELTVCVGKRDSKIETILTIIHELGHHLQFIHAHDRKPNEKLSRAYDDETIKENREVVYKYEKASATWWELIYKETGMRFPIKKLLFARDYDVWQYKVYWLEGSFPNEHRRWKKRRALRRKYE